jgi:hypothetical protein
MISSVHHYLKSHSRNRIVFFKENIPDIEAVDVGKKLSKEIKSIASDAKIGMKVLIIIDELFTSFIYDNAKYGKYLALQNVGILLEPELKLDFVHLLQKYSSSNTLFVKWEGEIDDGILYFLTKEKGQKIDIKNLSHIVI